MTDAEMLNCNRCKQPFPRRNYASSQCLRCIDELKAITMSQYNGKSPLPLPTPSAIPAAMPVPVQDPTPVVAVAHTPVDDYDSRTEARYADYLELQRRAGEIRYWKHKPLRFILAKKTAYNIDFMVVRNDGRIEMIEVKGSWKAAHQEDSRVKFKTCAAMFPMFLFVAVVPDGSGWEREELFDVAAP